MVQRNKLQAQISNNTGGMSYFTYETASDLPSTSAKLPFCMVWDKGSANMSQTTYLCSSIYISCIYYFYYFCCVKTPNFFLPNQIFYFNISLHFYEQSNLTLPSSL